MSAWPNPAEHVVVFGSLGRPMPWTFHAMDRGPWAAEVDTPTLRAFALRTACGRAWSRWSWNPSAPRDANQYTRSDTGTPVRYDAALRVGRPCVRCWPNAAGAAPPDAAPDR